MKILVVEDDEIVREIIKSALEQHGYTVIVASNGIEGMCIFYNIEDISIVITDYHMPEFNGVEVASYIKRCGRKTPVIMITGYSSEFSRVDAYKLGIDVYMEKPIDVQELLQTLAVLKPINVPCPTSGCHNG